MNALTDRRRSWSWLALVAVASTPSSAAESFTIEQVMSAPYPTSLVAAADADRIAWAENERGARSLWTAVGPAFEPERLVFYEEDDGQAIGGLRLSPDGSMLVFGRGGAPNPAGEIPNPASLIEPTERALWSVSTSGGDPWRLAEGGGAVINPDGARALFARAGEVFEVPLASPTGDEPVDATRLFKVRGGVGNLEPSPDGESVAFVSSRGDHSFVGVFHRADKRITWMSPSFDRDVSPVWSGDGRKIAFLRAPGALMHERIYYNTEVPFGIWVGDPATGEASEVWATLSGDGGFAQVASLWSLAWAGNDRLVFPSEAGGWLHYWSVAATGGDPVELTPGRGLVEWATLANDGRTLVFASNLASTHRRHLFSVPVDGGTPSQLTQGAVSDTGPVMVADQIAFRCATARRPPAVSLTGIAGGDVKTIGPALPASFPADSLIEPEVVSFEAADGLTIHGQLFRSESGDDERRRPAAIFLHGGPIRQMLPTFHYSSYYSNAFALQPVSGEPRLRRPRAELPLGYRLRPELPRRRGAGPLRRVGTPGPRRGRTVPHESRRRGSRQNRALGRLVRRSDDGDGARPRLASLRRRRGPSRRSRLGLPRRVLLAAGRLLGARPRRLRAGPPLIAGLRRRFLELPGPDDPRRRRSQRRLHPDNGPRPAAASKRCARRKSRLPRRGPRVSTSRQLGRGLQTGGPVLRALPVALSQGRAAASITRTWRPPLPPAADTVGVGVVRAASRIAFRRPDRAGCLTVPCTR